MHPPVIVVLYEFGDFVLKLPGQVAVLQVDHIL
jgi:hypothetical protein